MKNEHCHNCDNKNTEIHRLQKEKEFWIEMCNHLATENDHLHSRTLYGAIRRVIQILKHTTRPF